MKIWDSVYIYLLFLAGPLGLGDLEAPGPRPQVPGPGLVTKGTWVTYIKQTSRSRSPIFRSSQSLSLPWTLIYALKFLFTTENNFSK